jgi:hypothetical protein
MLPIEAQIHIKALTFFNNVCHQGETNTEKTGFVLVSFSGRVLVVQEVLRTVIM